MSGDGPDEVDEDGREWYHFDGKLRELLAHYVGAKIVDISQNDNEEDPFVELLFDNGHTIRFDLCGCEGSGFAYQRPDLEGE